MSTFTILKYQSKMSELFVHHSPPTYDYFFRNIKRSIKYSVKLLYIIFKSWSGARLTCFVMNIIIVEFPQRERISYFQMRTQFFSNLICLRYY